MITSSSGWTSFDDTAIGAKGQAMGEACTALDLGAESINWNSAGIGKITTPVWSISYYEPFGMESVRRTGLVYAQPVSKYSWLGLGILQFGQDGYHENIYEISYTLRIFKNLYIGTNFKYMELDIETVGNDAEWGCDVGILYEKDIFAFGMNMTNLNSPYLGESLPQTLKIGIGITPYDWCTVEMDYSETYSKISSYEPSSHFGLELSPFIDSQLVRWGIQTNPTRFSLGVGFKIKGVIVDYAAINHEALPITHSVTLTLGRW